MTWVARNLFFWKLQGTLTTPKCRGLTKWWKVVPSQKRRKRRGQLMIDGAPIRWHQVYNEATARPPTIGVFLILATRISLLGIEMSTWNCWLLTVFVCFKIEFVPPDSYHCTLQKRTWWFNGPFHFHMTKHRWSERQRRSLWEHLFFAAKSWTLRLIHARNVATAAL